MHNLALALAAEGNTVTGSDDDIHEPSKSRLAAANLLPQNLGWFPEKITPQLDAVILGMHARIDNPELARANELGIKVYSYPEFIYTYSRNKQRIVIAGSHGKTTITSMIMHVLNKLNIHFDYVVGAQIEGFDRTVKLSTTAPIIVIEGDEYFASPIDKRPKFLIYQPHIILLSGIAWDHINVYPTFTEYLEAFRNLIKALPKAGMVVYNSEDAKVSEMVWHLTDSELHYKYPYETPVYKIKDGITEIKLDGKKGEVKIFGQHNMANIRGSYEVCKLLGIEAETYLASIADFKGANMRLQPVYEDDRLLVIRDFAHAPSKVKATAQAVHEYYKDRNVIYCLELHTYSSLNKTFLQEYRNVFKKMEPKIVLISKHALEIKKMEPITSEEIHKAFHDNEIIFVQSGHELKNAILNQLKPRKNVVLLMSSGNLDGLNIEDLISASV